MPISPFLGTYYFALSVGNIAILAFAWGKLAEPVKTTAVVRVSEGIRNKSRVRNEAKGRRSGLIGEMGLRMRNPGLGSFGFPVGGHAA